MDSACDTLEREFKRINNDLEFVNHRLEAEFRSSPSAGSVLCSIFRRMQAMEAKCLKLKQKADILENEKAKFFNNTQVLQELEQNEEKLYEAMVNSGCIAEVPEDVAIKHSIREQTLMHGGHENISNTNVVVQKASIKSPKGSLKSAMKKTTKPKDGNKAPEVAKIKVNTKKSGTESETKVVEVIKTRKSPRNFKKTVPSVPTTLSQPDMESSSMSVSNELNSSMSMFNNTPLIMNDTQFLTLTKAKFDALPLTTRGRCKYSDISALYEKMLNYAQNYTMKPYALAQAQLSGKRRNSIRSIKSTSVELPQMTYTMKELIAGVPPCTAPFTSSLSAPRATTNKEYSMKISGKTGSTMLSILKTLNLITYNQINNQNENIIINLTENVEDYMLGYVASFKKTNTCKNVINDTNMSIILE